MKVLQLWKCYSFSVGEINIVFGTTYLISYTEIDNVLLLLLLLLLLSLQKLFKFCLLFMSNIFQKNEPRKIKIWQRVTSVSALTSTVSFPNSIITTIF